MANILTHIQKPGINAGHVKLNGYNHYDIDFAKSPAASGDVIPLFEMPKGAALQVIGAQVIKAEAPAVGAGAVKLYTKGGTPTAPTFTAVATAGTGAVSGIVVDGSPGAVYQAAGTTTGPYFVPAPESVYVCFVSGGAMKAGKVRVFAEFSTPPIV